MIIEQVDQNKIKVVVDSEEQKMYGITYETMTYCDCNTRKLCERIVERAESEVGFSVGDSKLLVEAKLGLNGTVTLFLSKLSSEQGRSCELFGQTVRFPSVNELLDSEVVFKNHSGLFKSRAVYLYDGYYYIYFEVFATQKEAKNLLIELMEFCDRSSLSADVLAEHGELIYSYL